jgi:hypothetical protein
MSCPCRWTPATFRPQPEGVEPLRIGFTGRFDDPRKNLNLLLHAMARLVASGLYIKARLIGGEPTDGQRRLVEHLNLQAHAEFIPYMDREGLRDELRRFDLFVLPSHQEGLCISALEAMACGCPVVSTRCGGPEEFVIDGQTGYLTGFDADEMAAAIRRIVIDRRIAGTPLRRGAANGPRTLLQRARRIRLLVRLLRPLPRLPRDEPLMPPPMRLTELQIAAIRETAAEIFGNDAGVWLFGSRTDDQKRGGDIDLLIQTRYARRSLKTEAILGTARQGFSPAWSAASARGRWTLCSKSRAMHGQSSRSPTKPVFVYDRTG